MCVETCADLNTKEVVTIASQTVEATQTLVQFGAKNVRELGGLILTTGTCTSPMSQLCLSLNISMICRQNMMSLQ